MAVRRGSPFESCSDRAKCAFIRECPTWSLMSSKPMRSSSPAAARATTTPGGSSSSVSPDTSTRSRSRRSGCPMSDAEDVFQEVFARAYVNLPKLRDDDAIRPWLAQLTRRLCLDTIRASARERARGACPSRPAPTRRSPSSTRRFTSTTRLRRFREQLPRDPRPLLRPRRELPAHRRGARPPCGHDREPDLALPREA